MERETLTLTVSLKIPDNEARSALEAIRVKMGFAEAVRDLAREEVWEIDVESRSPDSAAAELRHIVGTTNLFANPNKHSYAISMSRASEVDLDPDEVAILVSDRENARGNSMTAAVRRLGADSVVGVRRWVRWRLSLTRPPVREEPGLLSLIESIAVAGSRDGGLLCNPHIQEARVTMPWGSENILVR